jgi:hypothetical protein
LFIVKGLVKVVRIYTVPCQSVEERGDLLNQCPCRLQAVETGEPELEFPDPLLELKYHSKARATPLRRARSAGQAEM